MKSQKGFTALELLIVIAMIGILIAIALVSLNQVRAKSRDEIRVSNINLIRIALEEYRSVCKEYPDVIDPPTASTNCPFSQTTKFSDFLPNFPVNPGTTPIHYFALGDPSGSKCIGYHVGVDLETSSNILDQDDDRIDSPTDPVCATYTGFNGGTSTQDTVFDIYKN